MKNSKIKRIAIINVLPFFLHISSIAFSYRLLSLLLRSTVHNIAVMKNHWNPAIASYTVIFAFNPLGIINNFSNSPIVRTLLSSIMYCLSLLFAIFKNSLTCNFTYFGALVVPFATSIAY